MAAALCLLGGLGIAQSATPPELPAGTSLIFVVDDAVNAKTVRPGSVFKSHLSVDLTLDGTTLALAGTRARLIVVDRSVRPGGDYTLQIAFDDFKIAGGLLPVAPLAPAVSSLAAGTAITTKTMGTVELIAGRPVIRVPLPFALPVDAPNGFFTPIPARTAEPRVVPQARVRTPTPPPPSPTPTPEPPAAEM